MTSEIRCDYRLMPRAPERELFFAIENLWRQEGRNLLVYGTCVVDLVDTNLMGVTNPIPESFRMFCGTENLLAMTQQTSWVHNIPSQVVLQDRTLSSGDMAHFVTQRRMMNGTLLDSYVRLQLGMDGRFYEPDMETVYEDEIIELKNKNPTSRRLRRALRDGIEAAR